MVLVIFKDKYNKKVLNVLKNWGKRNTLILALELKYRNFNEFKDIINNKTSNFDVVFINTQELLKLKEECLIDFILDVMEVNKPIYIVGNKHDKLKEISNNLGCNNLVFEKDYKKVVGDLIDIGVLGEIFEIPSYSQFNLIDFMVRLEV